MGASPALVAIQSGSGAALAVNTATPQTGYAAHLVNTGYNIVGTVLTSFNLIDPAIEPRANNTVASITLTADSTVDALGSVGTVFLNAGGYTLSSKHNAGAAGGGYGSGANVASVVDWASGVFGNSGNQGAGTVTNACDFYSRPVLNTAGGAVTNYYGYFQETGSEAVSGVANCYGFAVKYASVIGQANAPTHGYMLDVVGKQVTRKAGSSAPASSGTTPGTGHLSRFRDLSGAVLEIYGNGASGYHLVVSDENNLATSYPLMLQNNGGATKVGGALTVGGELRFGVATASATTDATHKVEIKLADGSTFYLLGTTTP